MGPQRTGARDGVGLGLSIVKAIADAHAASVHARPGPDGGLDIEVIFPPAHIRRAAELESSPLIEERGGAMALLQQQFGRYERPWRWGAATRRPGIDMAH
jgi:hypothetical protein